MALLATLFAAAVVVVIPAGERFSCTPIKIWDADGPVWCAEGPKLRLHGIAAREMDGSCRPGHPCPDMGAEQARLVLATLLTKGSVKIDQTGHLVLTGAPKLACVSYGDAKGRRTDARCQTTLGDDVACKLIAAGAAKEWRRFSRRRYRWCGK
jgi:endonuclease YncB( thermonuclease family)